ncbi:MAG: DNA recombination protein RmuC, partial [Rubrivivax sp.]
MNEWWLVPALLAAVLVVSLLVLWRLFTRPDDAALKALAESLRQHEHELRSEVQSSAGGTRQELAGTLALFQQTLLAQGGDVARTQNEQIDSFRIQLTTLQQQLGVALQASREAQDAALRRLTDSLGEQLRALSDANERRLAEVRSTVESKLSALQQGNENKLEQMRATVDEKLHATLEQRLSESFKQVAERLEQVHKGLGDMQQLARDVGTLNRVLTNVKSRGVFGEVQLAGLLEQVLAPDQYAANVATVPGSNERVEFAVK